MVLVGGMVAVVATGAAVLLEDPKSSTKEYYYDPQATALWTDQRSYASRRMSMVYPVDPAAADPSTWYITYAPLPDGEQRVREVPQGVWGLPDREMPSHLQGAFGVLQQANPEHTIRSMRMTEYGWPLPCIYFVRFMSDESGTDVLVKGAVVLGEFGRPPEQWWLPYVPRVTGVVVNSGVGIAIVFGVRALLVGLLLQYRRSTRKCVKCGYDLSKSDRRPCPECGQRQ